MSWWAPAKPSRLSVRIVSTSFISFLIVPSRFNDEAGHLLDELDHSLVERRVALVVAEVRDQQVEMACLSRRVPNFESLRMRQPICGHEGVADFGREMAYGEHRCEVPMRDGRW